ncbi:hypothetical protein Y032_0008g179 [Ancylostoma ceylanicum]|uniref:Uncharacterized protein n=1 Tax=Ancylostoma ceylanicum TaxID=53326 RepID=A0A016VJI5_9BILA|nr:hypothetical protein Y032_0008g179 [Ancylostoma ceylanicum]
MSDCTPRQGIRRKNHAKDWIVCAQPGAYEPRENLWRLSPLSQQPKPTPRPPSPVAPVDTRTAKMVFKNNIQ